MLGGINGTTTLSKDARVERRGEVLWPMRARAAWPYLGSIRDVRADGAARAASRVSENKVTSLAALGNRRSQSNRFPQTSPLLPLLSARPSPFRSPPLGRYQRLSYYA